jgi:hypothetical protein
MWGGFSVSPEGKAKPMIKTQRMSPAVRHDRLLQQNPPVSDRRADIRNRQLRAKSRLMHRSKKTSYSITLSASPRSVGGTVKPRPVAAFKLITISNLTGA